MGYVSFSEVLAAVGAVCGMILLGALLETFWGRP